MRSLWRALEEFFVDPRLRQLFGRYATYNGSSPYHAPATLAVIAHVENAYGIFAVEGGIVRLAEALRRRAEELGVIIACNADVDEIVVEPSGGPLATSRRARGVRVNGGVEWADCVIANCDVADAYGRLLRGVAEASRCASTPKRSCRSRRTCCSPSVRRRRCSSCITTCSSRATTSASSTSSSTSGERPRIRRSTCAPRRPSAISS